MRSFIYTVRLAAILPMSVLTETSAHCSEKKFKAVEKSCTSKSKLARTLAPLLREPVSAASISRYGDEIHLIYPRQAYATKNLELITLPSVERQMMLKWYLERYTVLSSMNNIATTPVRSFSHNNLSHKKQTLFLCIEWKSLEDRATVLSDSPVRELMKSAHAEFRVPFLQELGKTEDDLTLEEDFDVFLRSTGAKDIQHRFVTAKCVTDDYLGLDPGRKKCVIV